MNKILSASVLLIMIIATSCNYSKYPIDKEPSVKVDEALFGIWKVQGDTDKANFILVQNSDDKSPPDKESLNTYWVTYFNRSGTNRIYENFGAFLSNVGKERFINLGYWDRAADGTDEDGYLLYRIIKTNAKGTSMTLAMVNDPALKNAKSAAEVREKVTKNINNKKFYSDTVELYSVSPGHYTQRQAVEKANK